MKLARVGECGGVYAKSAQINVMVIIETGKVRLLCDGTDQVPESRVSKAD